MHELPIVARVVELALGAAPPGTLVTRLDLGVGELCGVDPRWVERYFALAAKGTACASARLVLETIPGGTEWRLERIEVAEAPAPARPDADGGATG